ncbi:MAG: zeta toxin family protein [bacterium]|nr:zeta toxin family protein [bacterium]
MTTTEDQKLAEEAMIWVKQNQKQIVADFAGRYLPAPEKSISIFMAGSPGAGKTEFSRRLIEKQFGADTKYIMRIDPDEIRETLPCYAPGKSHIFQSAVSVTVEKIHDHALGKNKSFVLDGTLTNIEKARENIQRSLAKGRVVLVEYIYQDPFVAWDFTKKREVVEGRNIPRDVFINQFFLARENAMILKKEFRKDLTLDVVTRNISTNDYQYWFNVDNIDNCIKDGYSKEDLRKGL